MAGLGGMIVDREVNYGGIDFYNDTRQSFLHNIRWIPSMS